MKNVLNKTIRLRPMFSFGRWKQAARNRLQGQHLGAERTFQSMIMIPRWNVPPSQEDRVQQWTLCWWCFTFVKLVGYSPYFQVIISLLKYWTHPVANNHFNTKINCTHLLHHLSKPPTPTLCHFLYYDVLSLWHFLYYNILPLTF